MHISKGSSSSKENPSTLETCIEKLLQGATSKVMFVRLLSTIREVLAAGDICVTLK